MPLWWAGYVTQCLPRTLSTPPPPPPVWMLNTKRKKRRKEGREGEKEEENLSSGPSGPQHNDLIKDIITTYLIGGHKIKIYTG